MSSSAVATGSQGPEKRRNMPEGLQFGQRNGRLLAERPDGGATQRRQVADGAQRQRQVAAERPHIGALAAGDHEIGVIRVGTAEQLEAVDP